MLLEEAELHNIPLAKDTVFAKYANKGTPTGAKPTAGLTTYSGTWSRTEAIHLLRRTMFGVREADIQTLAGMTSAAAVDYLFSNAPIAAPAPPVNNYQSNTPDTTGVLAGQTWVTAAYGDGAINAQRRNSFKAWYVGQLLNQNGSILEKMTFFWANHFSTEADTIGDARYVYKHHAMLRANALGNFKSLVKSVTTDPGMLKYLNNYLNTKTAPDENYARELQELFTLGKTNVPNYNQNDVKAAAEVLTGWRINGTTLTGYFDATKHSTGSKQFSSFYNNALINYQSGANGANETDQLIDMIFAKTETAEYLCRRLYRYFVYYDIDATIELTIIAPLAQTLISNNFDVVPVLKELLKSDHFFDANSRGCVIRNPLDYLIGTFRTFGVVLPANFTVENTYKVWSYLRTTGSNIALDLADPPNVSGYPAYYQIPEYYEAWINSNTLPKRMLFTDMLLGSGFSANTGTSFKINVISFAQQCTNVSDPDMLVDWCVELLLGIGVSQTKKDSLKAILLSNQTSNYYWTQAWNNYVATPNTTNANIVTSRLKDLLMSITRLAEHQLS